MPEKMTLHYVDGSTGEMDALDARRVLRDHPSEWSTSPFSEEVQKAAKVEASKKREQIAMIKLSGQPQHRIDAALDELEAQFQERKAEADDDARNGKPVRVKTSEPAAPFEGKDKGAGWWAIFDANGNQVGGNIRKPEAESFNGMSDDDKLEYVKAELAKS